MFIPDLCKKMNIAPKNAAIIQISICTVIYISILVFSDFFLALSIYFVILAPLLLLSIYLFQNIYQGIRQLNLA